MRADIVKAEASISRRNHRPRKTRGPFGVHAMHDYRLSRSAVGHLPRRVLNARWRRAFREAGGRIDFFMYDSVPTWARCCVIIRAWFPCALGCSTAVSAQGATIAPGVERSET